MKLLVGCVVSGVLGFALGAWLMRSPAPSVDSTAASALPPAPAREPTPSPPTRAAEAPPRAAPPTAAVTDRAPTPAAPSALAAPPPLAAEPTARIAELEAQVQRLTTQLHQQEQDRVANEGQPLKAPADLPPRLTDERALVQSFNAALKEAGFPGQVTNVDCSEYPCIVYGTGFGAKGDMEKLQGTSAFGSYAKDGALTYGFQRSGKADERFFGVAMLAKDEAPGDALKKRVGFRVRQMEEVSRPPPDRGGR